jgi:hypothetical protein
MQSVLLCCYSCFKQGQQKPFPICIRYFDHTKVIENKLLGVVERADETAMLLEKLEAFHLNPKYISAYSADNANVNSGKYYSVFQLLRASNADIVKANCANHILHNAMKYACDSFEVDTENIVLKTFNFFSVSAKRRKNLESFFDFVELDWSELVCHVPTRWLSLTPAVKRLLQNWPALKSYRQRLMITPNFSPEYFKVRIQIQK